ncbi:MAG: hypothetical protein AAF394_13705 [Planctomycetota bacterium]
MQDEANLKDDANPYATPSLDALVQQAPDSEQKIRGRGWMVFSAYFCTAAAGGLFGLPFAGAFGLIIGFVWAGFVGTVPFIAMSFLARRKVADRQFRAALGLAGALTGFACVCIPFISALWNPRGIPAEGLFPLAVGALSAAALGGIGSVFGSLFVPRA